MKPDKETILAICNKMSKNTLMETLSITYIDCGADFLTAKMPVNSKVFQPMGLLHGGASVALAESVGSAASHMFIDNNAFEVRGLEISANHLRSKKNGEIFATAKVVHQGKTTHLWEVRITDEAGKLVSLCKITNIVLPKSLKNT